ncbi:hypothetical protein [Marinomonas lutimaris]|uniref:hypothetical protein n=1 Tax=Marinomonas lutimaris TaxID=2846746 RepID=UPI001CA4B29B|nr:hypothetical protein [Marinomonas lutimaris]
MIEALKDIPIAIWSVVLGSLITLFGVLISNRNNRKRLEIQLKHDAELQKVERKASVRREVYLSAAEELVKANNYLGSLAQIDLTKTNIAEGLQGFFTSAAKLGLVSEQETGKALNDLVLAYSVLFFRLLAKVSPINDSRSDINIINYHYDESQIEIKRILAGMTSQNESGAPNKVVFEALNKSFEFHSNRSKELTDERDECWKNVNELTRKFAIEVAEEMKVIVLLQIPVLVGIRKELDLETDIESYKQQVVNNSEKLSEQLDVFISSM